MIERNIMKKCLIPISLLVVGCYAQGIPKQQLPSVQPTAVINASQNPTPMPPSIPSASPSPSPLPSPSPFPSIEFTVLKEGTEGTTLPWVKIGDPPPSARPVKAASYVFHSEQGLNDTWILYFPDIPLKTPSIDFTRETAVMIYSGANSSRKKQIVVPNIIESQAEIIVNHHMESPALLPGGSGVAYMLIKFPRVGKAVSFVKGPDIFW